ESISRVMLWRLESSTIHALEHHHAIAPDTPEGRCFAETFWHRSEILADKDAAVLLTLFRHDAEQLLEWIVDVGALVFGARDTIKAHQPKHVIQPHRAGMAHRRGQQVPKDRKIVAWQCVRIKRHQSPILSRTIEPVRRCANRQRRKHRFLIAPGIST